MKKTTIKPQTIAKITSAAGNEIKIGHYTYKLRKGATSWEIVRKPSNEPTREYLCWDGTVTSNWEHVQTI